MMNVELYIFKGLNARLLNYSLIINIHLKVSFQISTIEFPRLNSPPKTEYKINSFKRREFPIQRKHQPLPKTTSSITQDT